MRLSTNDASSKSQALVETILSKIDGLNKPRRNFIISIIVLYLSLRGRYTFKGLERYGTYCEKTYRLQFEKSFDFLQFNIELSKEHLGAHRIIAFDPSYLPKSGKHTPQLDKFWSGCLGKAVKGLEIGGLGVVGIDDHTAMPLEAIQTPGQKELKEKGQSLVDHYAQLIIERKEQLRHLSKYVVVDGYFSKISFIDPVCEQTDLEVVSKFRKDADLKYLYAGPRKKGRGRPKKYNGKIKLKKIDKDQFQLLHEDQEVKIWGLICWAVRLKRKVNLAYVEFLDEGQPTGRYAVYFSTDLEMDGQLIYAYYKARYQIEFLFRDAKQYTGLTHCQSRDEKKMHFHFNTSLTAVGVAKAAHYLDQNVELRNGFSLANVKTSYFNELMLDLFLSNFEIDPELEKNKSALQRLLNFGRIAA